MKDIAGRAVGPRQTPTESSMMFIMPNPATARASTASGARHRCPTDRSKRLPGPRSRARPVPRRCFRHQVRTSVRPRRSRRKIHSAAATPATGEASLNLANAASAMNPGYVKRLSIGGAASAGPGATPATGRRSVHRRSRTAANRVSPWTIVRCKVQRPRQSNDRAIAAVRRCERQLRFGMAERMARDRADLGNRGAPSASVTVTKTCSSAPRVAVTCELSVRTASSSQRLNSWLAT